MPLAERLPFVTVQVPFHNERYVLPRLLAAIEGIDWPKDRIEVQLLDDSDDDSSAIAAGWAAQRKAAGHDVRHLRRADRAGFKAGALQAGLAQARGSFVAIFDADFVPGPSFLRAAVAGFDSPFVASVQARWSHTNEDHSWVTRALAFSLDAHFAVEQRVRSDRGYLLSFNGTAVVWRRAAIDDAGGWSGTTLAEDLDLSCRALLRGWTFRLVDGLEVPQEIPIEMNAFRRQQFRWARGSVQNARLHAGAVLRSRLPWDVKLETLFHLTHYVFHPLLFLLFVAGLLLPFGPPLPAFFPLAFALITIVGPLGIFVLGAHAVHGRRAWRRLPRLVPLTLIGVGICASNARAILAGLLRSGGRFDRTPKYGVASGDDSWKAKTYRLPRSAFPATELVLAAVAGFGAFLAWTLGRGELVAGQVLFALAFGTSAYAALRYP